MQRCDVAIVGAGPYGLAAAAHLTQVSGLDVRLFGEPMSFWQWHMPEGMLLRSPWTGSHIADPQNHLTLDTYRLQLGNPRLAEPIPLADFVAYGQWFYKQAGLASDYRSVIRIALAPDGYQVVLEDGETILAKRVVVAAGIQPFARRPRVFEGLPSSLVSHASEHRSLAKFARKEVLIVGGGQSAIESAALLSEAGAKVEVVIRRPSIHWLGRHNWLQAKGIAWLFYGSGGIGQAGVSLIVQRPNLFRRLPRVLQDLWGARAVRPAGAGWLRPRVQSVTFSMSRYVEAARTEGDRLRVQLDDRTERRADHLLLGTGYRINVAQYPFLAPAVLRRIELADGYPRLTDGFESTSPGLHFLGAPAAWSFGPLMKFVAGTEFAAQNLSQRIARAGRAHAALGKPTELRVQTTPA